MRPTILLGIAVVGAIAVTGANAGAPHVRVTVFARTGQNVDSIAWTGQQFLYVLNTENTVVAAPPAGLPTAPFATMPNLVEETRCILSPGTHGFPPRAIFCHSPDNKIYEISADGSTTSVFATLPAPYPPASDGALAFDNVGRFGYRLVAATGRSGAATPAGGSVYTIDATGGVQEIGTYTAPGGADEVVIAPATFGSFAGDALLTVDAGASGGYVIAMDPSGRRKTLASFPGDGPNPIVAIPTRVEQAGAPAPGVHLTDDVTQDIYYVSASQLAPFAGDLFVATEAEGYFWILAPHGHGIRALTLENTLGKSGHGLEGAIYIGQRGWRRARRTGRA